MHHHHRRTECGDNGCHLRVSLQAGDVVDEVSTRLQRRFCHRWLARIDRDRNRHRARDRLHDWHDPGALLDLADWLSLWSGALASDVNQVSSLCYHAQRSLHGQVDRTANAIA